MGRKELGYVGPGMIIRSINEIPLIKGEISPLRCLAAHWRAQAKQLILTKPHQEALYRVADELTAALNGIDNKLEPYAPGPQSLNDALHNTN